MISKLHLKNFRCFKDFSLEGLRPVTLISGANNIGKSTILDSLFLFMDRNSSDVFIKLNAHRGIYPPMQLSPGLLWEHLFSDLNTKNDLSISIENSGQTQSVTFCKDESFSISSTNGEMLIENSYPVKVLYQEDSRQDISRFLLNSAGITLQFEKGEAKWISRIQYMGPNMKATPLQITEDFSQIDLEGARDKCVEVLQELEERVKDLSVIVAGGFNAIYADIGLPRRIPINMLGAGMNQLMQIVLAILAHKNSILLIDEIENGFHYSIFPVLWKIIAKLAKETNCQVFATTHSYECIQGAGELASGDISGDLFRFIRLERHNDSILSHVYENDSFEYALNNNWEMR